jgi:PAS domain S-box-containing protein
MSLVVVLVFILIVCVLYFSSRRVRSSIDQIVESSLQQTVENSQDSRDFGLLNARLRVFENTFYLDEKWFETENKGLQENIQNLKIDISGSHLESLLEQLQKQFSVYLDRREWLNYLLLWRSEQDKDIGELILFLQEIIAEKMISVTLEGGEIDYLEQLAVLVSGYRESLLEIAKLNAEENPAHLLFALIDSPIPLKSELDNLVMRLGTLTASEPPINRLGQHLIDHFAYYQFLMRQYQVEMARLGELTRNLDQSTAQILSAMEQIDKQTAATIDESRLEIQHTILTTVRSVQFFLLLLAVGLWFALRNLFKNHIQAPMDRVSERLKTFQQGDHSSPMQLGRNDEWDDIEAVFNQMLADLQKGFSALQESEQRYREIFNNATEGIFRSTLAGQMFELNPAAVSMLGFDSAEEAISALSDLGCQLYQDPQAREQMLERLFEQGRTLDHESIMRRKNGDLFWSSLNNHLIRDDDGEILFIEGTIRDISAHKAAQESLQQLQSYLQNIIDSMPSVLIGVDTNMQVTHWNKRAEHESILTAEQAKGLSMPDVLRLFNPTTYVPKLSETLRTRKPTRLLKVESSKKAKNGSSRFFDILIYPLSLTEAGGAVIHIDDVTERLRLEEMMVRSEKMQSIGGLAAGLAHELNNPLAVILQSVQVLGRRLSPDLDQNRKTAQELGTTIETIVEYISLRGCDKMLHSISNAGHRAAKIVENVQSFSRRGGSNFIPCTISNLLERTVELAGSDHDMRHHFDFRKISIVRDYQSVPDVCCETSQIQQVFLSLLKNAAQALSLSIDDPQMTLRIVPSGTDHVCLQIEDNGSGMDADVAARIFDPFYTTREVGQGTGLGLSIAYFIVTHNHNGRLSVISEPGKGSCFEIILPLENVAEVFVLE